MAHQSPIRTERGLRGTGIPDKLYFRIGEVARLCDVPAYVLRFWESEFPQLKPNKGGSGQRLFRRRDVEMALRIKCLLYDEGYTIPGARQLLKAEQKQKDPQLLLSSEAAIDPRSQQLEELRDQLGELLAVLSRPVGSARTHGEPVRRQRSLKPVEMRSESLFDLGTTQDDNKQG